MPVLFTYFSAVWHRIISGRFAYYLGSFVLSLGLGLAFLPYTINRGWGWPEMISKALNLASFGHVTLEPTSLYVLEAKLLAYAADVCFFLAIIFIILLLRYVLFGEGKKRTRGKLRETSIGEINRGIRVHLDKLNRKARR